MRVLMMSTTDIGGGAARAAYRLHEGLQNKGTQSHIITQFKASDDPTVISPKTKFQKGFAKLRPLLDRLPLSIYPNRDDQTFSLAFWPGPFAKKAKTLNADIVHLHWFQAGFLHLEGLKSLGKPLIWTFHDAWPFTGGCHYPFECIGYQSSCGQCPQLGSKSKFDLSRFTIWRKHRSWQNLNITLVAPSNWLAEIARKSSIFSGQTIEVIPNGLDLKKYRPIDRQLARDILGLPQDKKIILFGALFSTTDKRKGFHLLLEAIRQLSNRGWGEKAELVYFGSRTVPIQEPINIKARGIGKVHDDFTLALIYSAADVFVAPSVQDNLPNTVAEAMACGTPVVSFNIGGLPDLIEHKKTGYLARPFDTADLSYGIEWVLEDNQRAKDLGARSRYKAEREWSLEDVSAKYLSLYERTINAGVTSQTKLLQKTFSNSEQLLTSIGP